MTIQASLFKKLLLASLATAALTLSACADKDSATTQDDVNAVADPQTKIEQEATGVSDNAQVNEEVNSAVVGDSAVVDDSLAVEPTLADSDSTTVTADEVADGEVMDGTEKEEHVSTY